MHLLVFSKINSLCLVVFSQNIFSTKNCHIICLSINILHLYLTNQSCYQCFFSFQSQDFLLHMPLGNSGSQQESVGGGRITVGAQTVPAADLSNSSPSDIACNCEACNERR